MWSLGNESGSGSNLGAMAAWAREARPVAPAATSTTGRAATSTSTAACTRRTTRSTPSAAARSRWRTPRSTPAASSSASTRTPWATARAGCRSTRRCSSATALPGRVRVGVDRPRAAAADARRQRALRLRRRLRRAAARRPVRRRRPAVPRPHAVAGPARVQEGHRARADHRRRDRLGHRWRTCTTSATCPLVFLDARGGGRPVAEGVLELDAPGAGETAAVALPALPATRGETWLTVRAVLAADEPWAPAGHEVAWGQLEVTPAAAARANSSGEAADAGDGILSLEAGRFDAATSVLHHLGDLALDGPRLDIWRADRQRHRHARPRPARGGLAPSRAASARATACSRSSQGRPGSWSAASGWRRRTPAPRPTRGASRATGCCSAST